jgi:hypothetical protein
MFSVGAGSPQAKVNTARTLAKNKALRLKWVFIMYLDCVIGIVY